MLLLLSLRNIRRNLGSRLPQAAMVAFTVGLLFAGNSLLESSRQGLRATYVEAFTGEYSVSSQSEESFNLFGSDLPLIGEYVVTPVLPDPQLWQPVLEEFSEQVETLPQVSAAGILLLPNQKAQAVPVFGVEADAYFQFFPALHLESGSLAPSFPNRLWVNAHRYQQIAEALGRQPELGESFDLGMTVRGSFLIRVVRLAGVYRYPGTDPVLDRTLLVDPDTARALNGYRVGATAREEIAPSATNLLGDDLEALFDGGSDRISAPGDGVDLATATQSLGQTADRDAQNATLEGTWNFLLLKGKGGEATWLQRLPEALKMAGLDLQIRDWAGTAGGNALVVSLLQVLFSVGLGLVALVAALIVMNSLALSVMERTQEIGTWRALGATKARVSLILGLETSLLVIGSAVFGLVLAAAALVFLAGPGIPVTNPVLASLFGTNRLHPAFSAELWAWHLVLTVVLALVACWLPIRRALAITPLQALQREGA